MITKTQAKALSQKTDLALVKTRQGGGGKMLSYLPHDVVTRQLNEVFELQWSFKVEVIQVNSDECIVKGILVIHTTGDVDITKEQYGSQVVLKGMQVGDALKGAGSDALRKCASLLGVGLDLYGSKSPAPNPIPHREQRSVTVRREDDALDRLQEEINYECMEQGVDLLEFQRVLGEWVWKRWKVLPAALTKEQCSVLTQDCSKIVHYYKEKGGR